MCLTRSSFDMRILDGTVSYEVLTAYVGVNQAVPSARGYNTADNKATDRIR